MRIAIFGHSYIRDIQTLGHNKLTFGDTKVELNYFPFPGACFKDFVYNKEKLHDVILFAPDIIVVILGGNDIKVVKDLNVIKDDCKEFYILLKSVLPKAVIIASQIEHRHLRRINKYNTPTAELYRKLANCFNRWLVRQHFKDKLLIINGDQKLRNEKLFKSDGVHLNRQGLTLLFEWISNCISSYC